ncbi:MAG: protein kinase [Candidatus Eisenbacteria bacterium]|nr:protein kinase [Candidatus Eisenbacteria bacterium]
MIGKTVSHYHILGKLGQGGMGVVYRAEDTKLMRQVALKFLSPELVRNPEAVDLFVQEARAASALDHPNICTIHEIEEADEGQIFIAMACYEGETLKQRLASGPLSVETALDIAMQVGDGLREAHRRGIVHRDINSLNIMITDSGRAKIMDFGVAKLAGTPGTSGPKTMVGTVAYVSPEQVGYEEVDHRTDIWSLGVVLYEMLSGKLPFNADYEQALVYSILNEEPKPLAEFRPDVPEALQQVVSRALEKDREKRYQDVEEFLHDLGVSSAVGAVLSERRHSIVVLPFEDISPGRDNEYFSDGLTEELINDLSMVRSLRVISRTSAMKLKGTTKDSKTIGKELNAQYLLEGSVRKSGDSLRINAQLIDAANDVTVWADKYSGGLQDVFSMQEKVSRAIVDALKLRLTPEETKGILERPIDNAYAYECYLKANQEVVRMTEDALERALTYLRNGLEVVGENALLYAGMAYAYWQYVNIGARQEDYVEKAEEYVGKAFELDPSSPKGHLILGLIYQAVRGDQQQSVRHFKRVLAVEPNNPDALAWLTIGYSVVGRTAEALPLGERLVKIEPLASRAFSALSEVYYYGGEFEEACEVMKRALDLDPLNPARQLWYAYTLVYSGRRQEGVAQVEEAARRAPGHFYVKLGLLLQYALKGDRATVAEVVTPDLVETAKRDPQYSNWIGAFYAALGDTENSLDWLENSVSRGFTNYPFMSKHDPLLANVRGEPRFAELMERVKVLWEQFEA